MYALAVNMPGFISYDEYASVDGENLILVGFATVESLQACRDHPQHLQAQERGRDEFFSEYRVQVCRTDRDDHFDGKLRHE
jgi:heme-degrading monooxygenase HmoA